MKIPLFTLSLGCVLMSLASAHHTGSSSKSILSTELARRQAAVQDATKLEIEGDAFFKEEKVGASLEKYQAAYEMLPTAPVTKVQKDQLKLKIDRIKSEYASLLLEEGRINEAKELVSSVVDDQDASQKNQKKAQRLLEIIEDPRQTNPAITPEYIENQERIQELLDKARGFRDLGQLDEALNTYEQILFIDPVNVKARKEMTKVNKIRNSYSKSAKQERRAYMLNQVDLEWEREKGKQQELEASTDIAGATSSQSLTLKKKAQEIRIPNIDFEGETLQEALDFIRLRSRELDPAGVGLNIVVEDINRKDENGESLGNINDEIIHSLRLTNVKVADLLKVLATQFELYPQYDDFAIRLVDGKTQLFTRTFRVEAGFRNSLDDGSSGGASDDPFASADSGGLSPRKSVRELLRDRGVNFSTGESASMFGNRLVVRGTSQTLDLVEVIVDNLRRGAPKQVMIKAKFIEVEQTNLDELGFDWGIGGLNFDSSTNVLGAGSRTFNNNTASITDGLRSGGHKYKLTKILLRCVHEIHLAALCKFI